MKFIFRRYDDCNKIIFGHGKLVVTPFHGNFRMLYRLCKKCLKGRGL